MHAARSALRVKVGRLRLAKGASRENDCVAIGGREGENCALGWAGELGKERVSARSGGRVRR